MTSPQPQSHPSLPGASIFPPTSTPSGRLNPRSCQKCRQRRVACDKQMPCTNCRRAKIPCIFPAPGRAPRRPRPRDPEGVGGTGELGGSDGGGGASASSLAGGGGSGSSSSRGGSSAEKEAELIKRLRKLEGIVEDLSGQIQDESARKGSGSVRRQLGRGDGDNATRSPIHLHTASPDISPSEAAGTDGANSHGRLVVQDDSKACYVSGAFWSKINNDVQELRDEAEQLLSDIDEGSDDDESVGLDGDSTLPTHGHHSFLLGYHSAEVNLSQLRPSSDHIAILWRAYRESIDLASKMLHIPTTAKLIQCAHVNPKSLMPREEALLFAIYYAAATAMEEIAIQERLGTDKQSLLDRYRFAVEQALARANLLTSSDIMVLQALTLFVLVVRRYDESKLTWTMTGVALRMAQGLGLHRDGSNFGNLSPFDAEMRRRLFWVLCTLDVRAAEDHGSELVIHEGHFDTRLPLNINDADISPESVSCPRPRIGATEMTFSLVRFELCAHSRRAHYFNSGITICPHEERPTPAEREKRLLDVYECIQNQHFRHTGALEADSSWFASIVARVLVGRMLIMIYQPVILSDTRLENEELRRKILTIAIDVCEDNYQLIIDDRGLKWRWLSQTYTQWQGITYALMEASRRPWGPSVERAWTAATALVTNANPRELQRDGSRAAIVGPLRKLWLRAQRHREHEVARLRADPVAARELEKGEEAAATAAAATLPTSFSGLSRNLRRTIAAQRWTRLIFGGEDDDVHEEMNDMPNARSRGSQSRPLRNPDNAVSTARAQTPMIADDNPEIMSLVDGFMSTGYLRVENFLPMINTSQDIVDNGSGTSVPSRSFVDSQQSRLESQPARGPTTNSHSHSQGLSSINDETPILDRLKADGNEPAWMWPDESQSLPQQQQQQQQQHRRNDVQFQAATNRPPAPMTLPPPAPPTAIGTGSDMEWLPPASPSGPLPLYLSGVDVDVAMDGSSSRGQRSGVVSGINSGGSGVGGVGVVSDAELQRWTQMMQSMDGSGGNGSAPIMSHGVGMWAARLP